jgi:hypothetical protein
MSLVSVALPSMARDLRVAPATLSFVVATSTLVYAGFLILGGRLADSYGQGRCCIAGLLLYATGAVAVATAGDVAVLIGARAVQGFGCAMLSPASFSMLNTDLPEGPVRHRGYGMFTTSSGAALVLGSAIGGVVTTALGWRTAFLLNVPFAALAVFIGMRFVPLGTTSRQRRRLDVPGAALVTLAAAAFVWGLSSLSRPGAALLGAAVLAAGTVAFAAFYRLERRTRHPLVPPELFRSRGLVAASAAMVCAFAAAAGVFLLPNLYMQRVLSYSAAASGAGMLPQAVAGILVGRLVTLALARFPIRRNVAYGFVCFAGSLALFALCSLLFPHGGYFETILPGLSLCGFSALFTIMMLMRAATLEVERQLQGVASAVAMAVQQIGLALGISLLLGVTAWSEARGISVAVSLRYAFSVAAAIAATGAGLTIAARTAPAPAPAPGAASPR